VKGINITSKKAGSLKNNPLEENHADAQADAEAMAKAPKTSATAVKKAPTFAEVKNLLQKNTCLACHNPNTRQVGPAYVDVAKRKYTIAQLIDLIHNPKPEHWPDYSTPMPPMPQVPNAEARKIAEFIKGLEKGK
jgi:cytochrome c551/c552